MKHIDVIGMGHALMDIIVNVDDSFLEDLQIKKGTMMLIDDAQHDRIIERLKGKEMILSNGGSASNTVKGVCILGGKSAFMGKIGHDEYGKEYESQLSDWDINASLQKGSKKTGISIICVTPDCERTMLTYLGAAAEFSEKDIDEKNERLIKDSKILHIEGFFVGAPHTERAVIKAMDIAKANDVLISMDLADPGLINAKIDTLKPMLKEYVDIVFVNENEAKAFTGKEEEDAAHALCEYCDISVVKLGSKGSIIKHHNKKKDTSEMHRIPIHKVEVVNTNGAGDSYASGILYSIAHDIPMQKAGQLASYISSRVVSIPEATLNVSLKDDVIRIVEDK